MKATYPSDVTYDEFLLIKPELLETTKQTHPRSIDIYGIFCAVLYRLREGCRWRSLPHDYPKWRLCYYHYNLWRKAEEGEESTLDRILHQFVESKRVIHGREQKTSGVTLHIGVDVFGLPHAMIVSTANVTDRNGTISRIGYAGSTLTKCVKVLADGGYTSERFATSVNELISADVEVVKCNELHTFAVLPKRWIAERSFGWLIIAYYGKIVNANSITRYKPLKWLLCPCS